MTEKCITEGAKPEYVYDGIRPRKENKKVIKKSA